MNLTRGARANPEHAPRLILTTILPPASDPRTVVPAQGSRRDSGGQRVHLDLREVPSFALFPGQVVAVQGVNASGGRMVCRGIIQGVPRPLPTSSPAELMRFQHGPELGGGKPLSIFVASGPFTTGDSLAYEPMNDLLGAVREARPDVVILVGPFVDAEHPQVGERRCQRTATEVTGILKARRVVSVACLCSSSRRSGGVHREGSSAASATRPSLMRPPVPAFYTLCHFSAAELYWVGRCLPPVG